MVTNLYVDLCFKLYYLIFQIAAILVTGGFAAGSVLTSVEVLSADGTPLPCTLPPLPTGRWSHTQDGLITCGGGDRNCLKLSPGGWVVSHNLLESRARHSSWQSPAGLVLIGGGDYYSDTTTELLSSSDSSSSSNFTLQYDTE